MDDESTKPPASPQVEPQLGTAEPQSPPEAASKVNAHPWWQAVHQYASSLHLYAPAATIALVLLIGVGPMRGVHFVFASVPWTGSRLAYLAAVLIVLLWVVPRLHAGRPFDTAKERWDAENDVRETFLQILGGSALLLGTWVAWSQLQTQRIASDKAIQQSDETLRLTRDERAQERFSKAVEHLSDPRVEIRVGGVYELEEAASKSAESGWMVQAILAAFVRRAAAKGNTSATEDIPPRRMSQRFPGSLPGDVPAKLGERRPPIDIQAAVNVLGRNVWTPHATENVAADRYSRRWGYHRFWIDLSAIDLRGADLTSFQYSEALAAEERKALTLQYPQRIGAGANLARVDLESADLRRALLGGARLNRANLGGVRLDYAWLRDAMFARANMRKASLIGADADYVLFEQADLEGADLRGMRAEDARFKSAELGGADLTGAWFDGADFSQARLMDADLTDARLDDAFLAGADLRNAILRGTTLDQTDLRGANLSTARGLYAEQLRTAKFDDKTKLPEAISKQLRAMTRPKDVPTSPKP